MTTLPPGFLSLTVAATRTEFSLHHDTIGQITPYKFPLNKGDDVSVWQLGSWIQCKGDNGDNAFSVMDAPEQVHAIMNAARAAERSDRAGNVYATCMTALKDPDGATVLTVAFSDGCIYEYSDDTWRLLPPRPTGGVS